MIDVIDHDNFGYETQAGDAMRGAFDWEMYYKRIPIPTELQKDDPSEPFEWVQLFWTNLHLWHNFLQIIWGHKHGPQARECRSFKLQFHHQILTQARAAVWML